MNELHIKTKCHSCSCLGTNDDLTFTFCQNGQCCNTKSLNGIGANCSIIDNFYGFDKLGDCANFEFNNESITGNVTLSGNDGWRGEWIRLVINGTIQKECSILTYLDGNHPDYFSSTNFVCPGGMTI